MTTFTNIGQKDYQDSIDNIFSDYDIFGGTDIVGNIKKNFNIEAVRNSLRVWFASKFGERYRNPNSGGIFFQQLSKNMSNERLSSLQQRCLHEIDENYQGILESKYVFITPDNTLKYFSIEFGVYCPLLGSQISDTIKIKFPS